MLSAELIREQIERVETTLKRNAEGRSVLELTAHDALVSGRSNPGVIEKLNFLESNLVAFITCTQLPSRHRVDFADALSKHPVGAKFTSATSKKNLMGLEADLDLVEQMAAHVVKHGKTIVSSSGSVTPAIPPAPSSYVPSGPPITPTAPSAHGDNAPAFPDAAAAVARGDYVGPMIQELAAITIKELRPPNADAPAEEFARHYQVLIATGQSGKAGLFWQRHRVKIQEALEDLRFG